MKVDNTDTIHMVENHIRSLNVIDNNVLDILKLIPRKLFTPKAYINFSHVDINIPIGNNQHMLMPSIEAKLLQALNIQLNENILMVGSGTGYLSSCVSLLGNKVHSIDIDNDLVEMSKKNSNQDFLKGNIQYEHLDLMSDLSIIKKYNIIILTSSIDDLSVITEHMSNQSRAFIFLGKKTAPVKTGFLIKKLKASSLSKEYIAETDVSHLIVEKND
jgi:protein-L-isoaspartate(D-aspartate) O-methyltransferase